MAPTQKSVLVTGCSAGGIGEALAAEFQEKGWLTFATARNLKKVQHLEDTGCKVLELDVTNEETIKNAVKEVELRTGGKLDMLINNAGMTYTATVLDSKISDVKKLFDTNVFGLLSVTQSFAPLLFSAKGTIVNIGSIAALVAGPYASLYSGSKISVEYLSHAMRQEMEPFGLKVVHVTVGVVATHVHMNNPPVLPHTSLYAPIKKKAEALMVAEEGNRVSASELVAALYPKITKTSPTAVIYQGPMVFLARLVSAMAWIFGPRVVDLVCGGASGLNDLARIVRARQIEDRIA